MIYITLLLAAWLAVKFNKYLFLLTITPLFLLLQVVWNSAIILLFIFIGCFVIYKLPKKISIPSVFLVLLILTTNTLTVIIKNKQLGVTEYLFPKFILYHILVGGIFYFAIKYKKSSYLITVSAFFYAISLFIQRISPFVVILSIIGFYELGLHKRVKRAYTGLFIVFFLIIDLGVLVGITPIIGLETIELANRNQGEHIINLWDKGHAYRAIGFNTDYAAQPLRQNETEQIIVLKGLLTGNEPSERELSNILLNQSLLLEEDEYSAYVNLAKYYGIKESPNNLFQRIYKNETYIYMYIYDSIMGANTKYLLIRGKQHG